MTSEQTELLHAAGKAARNAYAPYSNFHVGAAALTEKGIFVGFNIENSCTNLGTCAERVALANARVNGCKNIIGIAVVCIDAPKDAQGNIEEHLAMPCGGCRQWMAELAPDAWLITNASKRVYTLKDLLPVPFVLNQTKEPGSYGQSDKKN
ncbi:MAG: cytidine deaminase [Desulfobacteraceae bacterium]|nr:cytidine deaminase [Desulfobacteraceae bacterium]